MNEVPPADASGAVRRARDAGRREMLRYMNAVSER